MSRIKTTMKTCIQFSLAALAMLGMVQTASAVLVLQDNFQSYTSARNQASGTNALVNFPNDLRGGNIAVQTQAAASIAPGWDANIATINSNATNNFSGTGQPNPATATIRLFPDPTNGANQTVRRNSFAQNSGRIDRLFDGKGGPDPTGTSTVLITPTSTTLLSVKWRFYDSGGTGTALPFDMLTIGGGGAPQGAALVLGVGLVPTLNGRGTGAINTGQGLIFADNTKYQASGNVSNTGPFFNLATSRLVGGGWVTFELLVSNTKATLLVNGVADANFTNKLLGIPDRNYGRLRIGQIQGDVNNDPIVSTYALWDDISVNFVPGTVPEPSAFLVWGLVASAGGLACRRWRK